MRRLHLYDRRADTIMAGLAYLYQRTKRYGRWLKTIWHPCLVCDQLIYSQIDDTRHTIKEEKYGWRTAKQGRFAQSLIVHRNCQGDIQVAAARLERGF